MKALSPLVALIAAFALAAPALASSDHNMEQMGGTHAEMAAPLSEGTVTKVDKAGGKITIKHGPLKNLDMPAMTMAFKTATADMLGQVKPGDAVRFLAESVDGALTVTRIEIAR